MAFQPKIDRCGIVAATTPTDGESPFLVRDAVRGGEEFSEVYEPDYQCGQVDFEPYGEDAKPSNSYALRGGAHTIAAGAIKLGAVTTVTERAAAGQQAAATKSYGLSEYNISTQTSNPVSIDASAQLLEDGVDAEEQAFWPLPEHKINSHQCPQDIYGSFTLSGAGCSLQSVDNNAKVDINPDKIAGRIISSDSAKGYITVTGSIIRSKNVSDNEPPTITPNPAEIVLDADRGLKSKWVLIKMAESTENNPETAYPTYEFELRLPLKKVKPWEEED